MRSDSNIDHSAAPVYFLTSQVLGVTPAAPGFRRIRIAPKSFGLKWASGTVPTPHGAVHIAWHIDDNGKMQLETHAPEGCEIEIVQFNCHGFNGSMIQNPTE